MTVSNNQIQALSGPLSCYADKSVINGLINDINTVSGAQAGVAITASTATALSSLTQGGRPIVQNNAAGVDLSLPAAIGSGVEFEILIQTTITSNDVTVTAPAGSSYLGQAIVISDNAAAVVGFVAASGNNTITLNGTTLGGRAGDRIKLRDMAAGIWMANLTTSATGTEATPFSTV